MQTGESLVYQTGSLPRQGDSTGRRARGGAVRYRPLPTWGSAAGPHPGRVLPTPPRQLNEKPSPGG